MCECLKNIHWYVCVCVEKGNISFLDLVDFNSTIWIKNMKIYKYTKLDRKDTTFFSSVMKIAGLAKS